MTENKGIWLGGIGLAVLVLLGLWWFSSSNLAAPAYQGATASPSTNTTGTGSGNSSVSTVDRSSSDVASIAASISGASTFASWLASTGVAAEGRGKGPYPSLGSHYRALERRAQLQQREQHSDGR